MTNLTEQWKKGELESGWYYVNFYSVGAVMQEYLPEHNGFGYDEKNLIQEVLAPVPSYEEFDNTTKCYLCAHEKADRLEKENQKLKELLKECSCFFVEGTKCDLVSYRKNDLFMMLEKITNAIGEKKCR